MIGNTNQPELVAQPPLQEATPEVSTLEAQPVVLTAEQKFHAAVANQGVAPVRMDGPVPQPGNAETTLTERPLQAGDAIIPVIDHEVTSATSFEVKVSIADKNPSEERLEELFHTFSSGQQASQ